MRISVKVKPNARKNEVKVLGENTFQVSVTVPPVDGKANEKVVEVLAEYFHKPKRGIEIHSGHGSRMKIVDIE